MLVVYHIGGQITPRASQRRLRGPYPRQKSISILPLMSATNADTPTNNSWIFPPASISAESLRAWADLAIFADPRRGAASAANVAKLPELLRNA
jgi:hypothetical protein